MKSLKDLVSKMEMLIKEAKTSIGNSSEMEKIQKPMPPTLPLPKDTKKQGESTMGSQVRTANANNAFKPGSGKSSMDGAKDAAKQSLSDTKSMPKPNLPKAEGVNTEDKDKDMKPDVQEEHGKIDDKQDDLNQDGQVTHDEAVASDEQPEENNEQADSNIEDKNPEIQDENSKEAPVDPEMPVDENVEQQSQDSSEYIYIAGDGDSIGAQVGQAMLHDDVEGLHAVSSKINQGQDAFQQWLSGVGGEMISAGGDEFVARVPAQADLSSIEEFRNQYNQTVGATVTIGTGSSMSQAGKALIYGKLNGKDQIAQYDESMEQFLQDVQSGDHGDPMSDEAKQKDHYLNSIYDSNDGMDDTSSNPASAVEQVADGQVPMEEQPMNEDIGKDDEADEAGDVNAFESVMADSMSSGDGSYLKEQMMNVLEGFKKDKEFIENMKNAHPEVYAEIIGLLHQMIKTSKMLNANAEQPMQTEAAPVEAQQASPEEMEQPEEQQETSVPAIPEQ